LRASGANVLAARTDVLSPGLKRRFFAEGNSASSETAKRCPIRLLHVSDREVTFHWKDDAHHQKRRVMTLSHEAFLRRLLQ
jgi:hypothetical protein